MSVFGSQGIAVILISHSEAPFLKRAREGDGADLSGLPSPPLPGDGAE
jgi:hypothetical protein